MHRATARFWSCFDKLPAPIQLTARKNYGLIKDNPKHPSLHFKKVGVFGLQELVFITVLLHWKMKEISFGYGLEHMKSMNV